MTTSKYNLPTMETYSHQSGSALRRIRTPHPHDVLSGRGGGINSHDGNKIFREWVRERKEAYNLAGSKAEKARIANEVIQLVRSRNPPGRFLQRDPSSVAGPGWWIEVDETRAAAKTSQALREGAPQIRAAHLDELEERVQGDQRSKQKRKFPLIYNHEVSLSGDAESTSRKRKYARKSTIPSRRRTNRSTSFSRMAALESLKRNVQEAKATAEAKAVEQQSGNMVSSQPAQSKTSIPPLLSNEKFNHRFGKLSQNTGVRCCKPERESIYLENETPPLTSAPFTATAITPLSLGKGTCEAPGVPASCNGMRRSHSLALSDLSTGDFADGEVEFVNPFADESSILGMNDAPSLHRNSTTQHYQRGWDEIATHRDRKEKPGLDKNSSSF